MDKHPVTIEFQGVVYKRNPDGKQRAHRVYYAAPRGRKPSFLHRAIWEAHHGPIPAGAQVHHQDDDPFNNDPANLVLVTPRVHAQGHAPAFRKARQANMDAIRHLTAAWHGSTEGRDWHSEHGRATWVDRQPIEKQCATCGKTFQTLLDGRGEERYCSRACHRKRADADHAYERRVACPVCETEFWQNKYRAKPETCSRLCGAALRRSRNR
jgi:hypothetical protein